MTEEDALIQSFVTKAKRERVAGLLANRKRRAKATSSLAYFHDLDPRWVITLPPDQQDPASVERALRSRGAGDTCYAISEAAALDGKRFPLRAALEASHRLRHGYTVVVHSRRPGVLRGRGPLG